MLPLYPIAAIAPIAVSKFFIMCLLPMKPLYRDYVALPIVILAAPTSIGRRQHVIFAALKDLSLGCAGQKLNDCRIGRAFEFSRA